MNLAHHAVWRAVNTGQGEKRLRYMILRRHQERHRTDRIGWLRAAVLGAACSSDDSEGGIVSSRSYRGHESDVDITNFVNVYRPTVGTRLDDCQTCHKPHFAAQRALLVEPVQSICAQCHEVGKAPFAKAHLGINPADMDCMSCHNPHASKDPKFFKDVIHPPFAGRTCDDCHIKQ